MLFTVVQFDYLHDVDLASITAQAMDALGCQSPSIDDVWAIAEYLDLVDAGQLVCPRVKRQKFVNVLSDFIAEHIGDDSLVATYERSAILFDVYQSHLDLLEITKSRAPKISGTLQLV